MENLLLQKYTSDWVKDFEDIKTEIQLSLGSESFTIEHVGSTSVPYLDAKPIIDIDIIFSNQNEFEIIKSSLELLGYYHNGNQGIDDREVFKRSGKSTTAILDKIPHHLYVCKIGSEPLLRHILSRDFLRKHEWARITYQSLKYEMAALANQDRKKYQELKELHVNQFIDDIIGQSL